MAGWKTKGEERQVLPFVVKKKKGIPNLASTVIMEQIIHSKAIYQTLEKILKHPEAACLLSTYDKEYKWVYNTAC